MVNKTKPGNKWLRVEVTESCFNRFTALKSKGVPMEEYLELVIEIAWKERKLNINKSLVTLMKRHPDWFSSVE